VTDDAFAIACAAGGAILARRIGCAWKHRSAYRHDIVDTTLRRDAQAAAHVPQAPPARRHHSDSSIQVNFMAGLIDLRNRLSIYHQSRRPTEATNTSDLDAPCAQRRN